MGTKYRVDLKERVINTGNWVDSAHDMDYWRAFVNVTSGYGQCAYFHYILTNMTNFCRRTTRISRKRRIINMKISESMNVQH